ncbi:MAG: clan AA aspartic protease [Thermoguttaceae bacterium]|jgi:clan AA aspartic protease|nr:clan AA aspartic protease [Thermoguttaceae bacterium]
MISGVVKSNEARIRLNVKGPQRQEQDVDAVIDTGYTGSLTLPPSLVRELELNWQSVDRGMLADGSECLVDVYEAKIVWDGELRRVLVDEANAEPLVGMALLSGYELNMEVRSDGKVTIKRLSPR